MWWDIRRFCCFLGHIACMSKPLNNLHTSRKEGTNFFVSQNIILSFKNLYYSQLWSYSVFAHNLTITTCVALLFITEESWSAIFLPPTKKEEKKHSHARFSFSRINLNIHIAYIFSMHLCKISQWLKQDIYLMHTQDTQDCFYLKTDIALPLKQCGGWWSDICQYTQDTGTHCGVEVARSMASSTPFTLSSTSLLTRTTSKKCPYVEKMASDSFWIICRFSIWGKMVDFVTRVLGICAG